jgi:hypothetical protein
MSKTILLERTIFNGNKFSFGLSFNRTPNIKEAIYQKKTDKKEICM